jgi:NUMOD3 motif
MSQQKIFYVYIGEHPITGDSCYIGKGSGKRMVRHDTALRGGYHHNGHLQHIFDKYGQIHWSKVREGLSEVEALETEAALIAYFGRANSGTGILCNRTDGGDGVSGLRHTEETRRKMSKPISAEVREKISQSLTGKKLSAETKRKMSESHSGKERSKEHRENLSRALKGRPPSEQAIAAALIARANRPVTPEHRAKISRASHAMWARRRLSPQQISMEFAQ